MAQDFAQDREDSGSHTPLLDLDQKTPQGIFATDDGSYTEARVRGMNHQNLSLSRTNRLTML